MTIEMLMRDRPCFVCGVTGPCGHRQTEAYCAELAAIRRADHAAQIRAGQMWLPGMAPAEITAKEERVH